MHQAELRLLHRHHVGAAGIEALAIDSDCMLQRAHLDAMQQQQFQQATGQCRIVRVAEHEALHRLLCGLLQRALEEMLLQVEQAAALSYRTTHRAQPGGDLVADGERKVSRPFTDSCTRPRELACSTVTPTAPWKSG